MNFLKLEPRLLLSPSWLKAGWCWAHTHLAGCWAYIL
ncbi:hypothetical protein EBS67_18380 [bacterium]|nr:hypothetical protein [bacterium]